MTSLLGALAVPPGLAAADAPSTQRVAGYAVRWPAPANLNALRPGDTVRLSLSRGGAPAGRVAVVSLVRVARSGRPLALVANRRVRRRGTFAVRLPDTRGGRYRLRVAIGRSRASRLFTVRSLASEPTPAVPAPSVAPLAQTCGAAVEGVDVDARLQVEPRYARPGDTVRLTLTNTGVRCLFTGYGPSWQVYENGTWREIPLNRHYILLLVQLDPGATFIEDFPIPEDASPGSYRLVKTFAGGNPARAPAGPSEIRRVAAEVTVTP